MTLSCLPCCRDARRQISCRANQSQKKATAVSGEGTLFAPLATLRTDGPGRALASANCQLVPTRARQLCPPWPKWRSVNRQAVVIFFTLFPFPLEPSLPRFPSHEWSLSRGERLAHYAGNDNRDKLRIEAFIETLARTSVKPNSRSDLVCPHYAARATLFTLSSDLTLKGPRKLAVLRSSVSRFCALTSCAVVKSADACSLVTDWQHGNEHASARGLSGPCCPSQRGLAGLL